MRGRWLFLKQKLLLLHLPELPRLQPSMDPRYLHQQNLQSLICLASTTRVLEEAPALQLARLQFPERRPPARLRQRLQLWLLLLVSPPQARLRVPRPPRHQSSRLPHIPSRP